MQSMHNSGSIDEADMPKSAVERQKAAAAEIDAVLAKYNCFLLPRVIIVGDKVATEIGIIPRSEKKVQDA